MDEESQYVSRPCPLQGAARSIDFSHSHGQRGLGDSGAQQRRTNDSGHFTLLTSAKMSLVLLHDNEIRMKLRRNARKIFDLRIASIAGMPQEHAEPADPTAQMLGDT